MRAGAARRQGTPLFGSVILAAAVLAPGCLTDQTSHEEARAALSGSERADLVEEVRQLTADRDVEPIPPAPEVSDEMFDLGQALMFDKLLSGDMDVSCMTCHPPEGPEFTSDDRHMSLGVGGVDQGQDRIGGRIHFRNSLPLFNLHALDVFFFDGRLEQSSSQKIRNTPADEELPQEMIDVFDFGGLSALGLFPVVSRLEMRGQWFKNQPQPDNELAADLEFQEIWAGLMDRLAEVPEYVNMFEQVYPDTEFEDMNFGHASNAMAGFMVSAFEARESPFQQFLAGDDEAMSDSALRGAADFFAEGSCATCHAGPMLTDEEFHNTALAQFGPGLGDGPYGNDDFGRAGDQKPFSLGRVPGGPETPNPHCKDGKNPHDLYAFRPPPLHNVELTGPWGHVGQFSDLRDFVSHYEDPEQALLDYDIEEQLLWNEQGLADMFVPNTEAVLSCVSEDAQVTVPDMDDMVAFLESLTDPGSLELGSTIPDEVPSGLPVSDGEAPEVTGDTDSGATFTNIATDPENALSEYRRAPSARKALADQMMEDSLTAPEDFFDHISSPLRWRGLPGVAVFDYTGDGAMDIFVTNGPGAPNKLFENQLAETGELEFIDRAAEAGVAAVDTDSSGVCYGDINNNGYSDLYVVADNGRSHLFKNNGDGTFTDISDESNATPDGVAGTGCSFGDVTGNGKLDLFVGRGWHLETQYACFTEPFGEGIQHNELYINQGDGVFEDVSETSGIRELGGLPPGVDGPTITWAVAMVDYNQNGVMDILHGDDQCGLPDASVGGVDRGFIQVFENDGTGNFTNRTVEAGTAAPSSWMGFSFGDFNSSGELDLFATSFGDWGQPFLGAPGFPEANTSRWWLGQPDGTFEDPHVGDLEATPFGWGTSAQDFDNDGNVDVVYHGGLHLYFVVEASNPGTMLVGDGAGGFRYAPDAFDTNYTRRNTIGVAAGDLNQNGFQDVVSVSNFDIPDENPVVRYGSEDQDVSFFASIFDQVSYFSPVFEHVTASNPEFDFNAFPWFEPENKLERRFRWNEDVSFPDGTLAVEINDADSENNWVSVELMGTVGIIPDGEVNRSGIGATITFTAEDGNSSISPVLGGASHLSQDSLVQGFGLGEAHRGTVDILWPGGTKNRLYDVQHGEQVFIPELPCSYDTSDDRHTYAACVEDTLFDLQDAGVIDANVRARMQSSALRAYDDVN